jgi:hypothetical protein
MARRLRLSLLVCAMLLTGLAASTKAPAQECTPGTFGWANFGSCCWQLGTVQLLRARCSADGYWEVYDPNLYKCPPEPC